MARTGCSERHIKAIRNGHRKPSAKVKRILAKLAAEFARKFMPEARADDLDVCAAMAFRAISWYRFAKTEVLQRQV